MITEELQGFLASVRKPNFIDYLDPMGETAQQALERRVKWAARNRRDPSHEDEAEFLLRYEKELKQVVLDELMNDDDTWAEEAEVGTGWGQPTPYGSSRREDNVTNMGNLDTVDVADAETEMDESSTGAGIMRIEDISDPPAQPRTDAPSDTPDSASDAPVAEKDDEEGPGDADPTDESMGDLSDIGEIQEIKGGGGAVTFSAEARDEGHLSWASGWSDHETPGPSGDRDDAPTGDDMYISYSEPDAENESEPTPLPAPKPLGVDKDAEPKKTALSIRASQNRPTRDMRRIGGRPPSRRNMYIFLGLSVILLAGGVGAFQFGFIDITGAGAVVEPDPAPEPVVEPHPEPPEPEAEPVPPEPIEGDDDDVVVADMPDPARPTPPSRPTPRPDPVRTPTLTPTPRPDPVRKPTPTPTPATVAPTPKPDPVPDEPKLPPKMTGTWAGIAANTSFELTVDSQNGRSFAGIGRIMNEEGDWETFPILGSIEADGSVKFAQQGGGHSFRGNYKGMRTSGTVTLADGSTGKFSVIR